MKRIALFGYVLFICLLMSASVFFSPIGAVIYLSFATLLMGIVAIALQKMVHREKILDMGFRLNRNALLGLGIGLLFTGAAVFSVVVLPCWLGLAKVVINEQSTTFRQGVPPGVTVPIVLAFGGLIAFVFCLVGEELAFRGYVLPKLAKQYGSLKAVILCSVIFGLWHLPAYFSIYSGGAAEAGWGAVVLMLFAHAISVVPLSILYLTTRELYGVSLYHALVDVLQYSIVANPAMGDASRDAVYRMTVLNEPAMGVIGWAWHAASILMMIGLCRIVRPWVRRPSGPPTPEAFPG
jgi:membrane protease YdiL (CAAX protease family)